MRYFIISPILCMLLYARAFCVHNIAHAVYLCCVYAIVCGVYALYVCFVCTLCMLCVCFVYAVVVRVGKWLCIKKGAIDKGSNST